jgi:acetoin utilization deacetylase AcuC-like enzyme
MRVAYYSHSSSLLHEMGPGHPECPERIAAITNRLVMRGVMDRLDRFDAPEVTRDQTLLAHTADYIDALPRLVPLDGYRMLDADTAMNAHSLRAAQHAAGACVAAVDRVVSGQADRAFCAVRPPGHHALSHHAMGFCILNNVAIGVRHAIARHGLKRVVLIDFDVHHGNGSEQILAGDDRVLMLSTFQSPHYPGSGETPLADNMINVALSPYSGGLAMRAAVRQHWWPALKAFDPQLIVVSAGFDAHQADDLGQLGWRDEDYAWLSAEIMMQANHHCAGRVVSSLEGGYDLGALARCTELHIEAMLQD